MALSVIPVAGNLQVEGESDADDVGSFSGRVIAILMQDTDPVSAATPESEATGSTEGLAGFGTTYFLVADEEKPHPVWVEKQDITKHGFGDE